ncbi:MAG: SUMF1/EgtB/PvdO family nonheme iron enzyme [Opitutales bacterium]
MKRNYCFFLARPFRILAAAVLFFAAMGASAQVEGDLWVFGSPASILSGETLAPGLPTAALTERFGSVSGIPEGVAPWRLAGVRADRILIRYSEGEPPEIPERALVANLTPATKNDVFLRRVTGMSDNPNLSLLTLFTKDVAWADLVEDWSFSLDTDAVVYSLDAQGRVDAETFMGDQLVLPEMAYSVQDVEVLDNDEARLHLHHADWSFTPQVSLDFTLTGHELSAFEVSASGPLAVDYDVELEVKGDAADMGEETVRVADTVSGALAFLGIHEGLPVWAAVRSQLEVERYHLRNYPTTVRGGLTDSLDLSFSATYQPEENLKVFWERSFVAGETAKSAVSEFSVTEGYRIGRARGNVFLHPRMEIELVGVGSAAVDPRPELNFKNYPDTETPGKDEPVKDLEARLGLYGELTLLGAIDNRHLNWLSPYQLGFQALADPADQAGALTFHREPLHRGVVTGHPLVLNAYATAGGDEAGYQWYKDGAAIPGAAGPRLVIPSTTADDAGEYTVQAVSGSDSEMSKAAVVKISPHALGDPAVEVPEGFVYIPAGSFRYGADREKYPRQFLTMQEGEFPDEDWVRPSYWYGTNGHTFRISEWEELKTKVDLETEEDLEWAYVDIAQEFEDGRLEKKISNMITVNRHLLISPLIVQQTSMTWERYQEIRDWGLDNGYDFAGGDLLKPGPGDPTGRRPGEGADPSTNEQHPVTQVHWYTAVKIANALSEMEGREPLYRIKYDGESSSQVWRTGGYVYKDETILDLSKNGYRLPHYAEYHYINRAGTTTDVWGGNLIWDESQSWHDYYPTKVDPVLNRIANYLGSWIDNPDISHMTAEVGSKQVNPFGLYDTVGNSKDWVNDKVGPDWQRWEPNQEVDPYVRLRELRYIQHSDPSDNFFRLTSHDTIGRKKAGDGVSTPRALWSATPGGSSLGTIHNYPENGLRLVLNTPQ